LNKKQRNKNGNFKYSITTVLRMAAANNVAGQSIGLPDFPASGFFPGQAGRTLALFSLAVVVSTHGNAVGA
jgi:hypothetical protein